jgi:hypothetical protein
MTNYILHQQGKSRQKQLLFRIALLASNSDSAGEVYKTVSHHRLCQVLTACPQKASGDKIQD